MLESNARFKYDGTLEVPVGGGAAPAWPPQAAAAGARGPPPADSVSLSLRLPLAQKIQQGTGKLEHRAPTLLGPSAHCECAPFGRDSEITPLAR